MPVGKLTEKQEAFAYKYVELDNATAAYIEVYDCDNSTTKTICTEAWELMRHPDIARLVEEIREKVRKKKEVTIEKLSDMYESSYTGASAEKQYGAAVSATNGLGTLHGLLEKKIKIEGGEELVIALTRGFGRFGKEED